MILILQERKEDPETLRGSPKVTQQLNGRVTVVIRSPDSWSSLSSLSPSLDLAA